MMKLPPLSQRPLVSIIIPSHNQGRFIEQTLKSIIGQDYRPIEVWVIDGASTDNTLEVLHKYDNVPEISWISEPDSGVVEAVNKGFEKAQGKIGAVQSSDDFYLPGAVNHAVDALCSAEKPGLVYGDYVKVDAAGKEINRYRLRPFSLPGLLARETFIPQSAAFFRMDLFRQLGGWDSRIPYVPDTDFWFRIAFHSRVKKLNVFLGCSRAHPNQRDRHVKNIYRDYKVMLRQSSELANAPRHLQRASKAGLCLLSLRYNIHQSNWEMTKACWKAVFCYPRCLLFPTLQKHRLIFGYFRIMRVLGNIRRLVWQLFDSIFRIENN